MWTIKNYFDKVKGIDLTKVSAQLKEGYDFVREATEEHTTWDYYKADSDIKAVVDKYLADLNDFFLKKDSPKPTEKGATVTEKEAREVAKKLIRADVSRGVSMELLKKTNMGAASKLEDAQIRSGKIHVSRVKGEEVSYSFPLHSIYQEELAENGHTPQPAPSKPATKPAKPKKRTRAQPKPAAIPARVNTREAAPVERIDDAVRFIKRYALLHGKTKTDMQVLNFINSLQRAILEKRIRKSSEYASQIQYIQENLIKLYNKMGREVEIQLKPDVLQEFISIAGMQQVRLSVAYMKRYVGMQGKYITKEKAQRLHSLIAEAVSKQKIKGTDPYIEKIKRILSSLKHFVDKATAADTLHLHSAVLNGIEDALGCGCTTNGKKKEALDGIDDGKAEVLAAPAPERIMNSMDFADMKFETLGFMGKWKNFIGDPAAGFSAMISAKPKMGKSYLSADFAGYLARNHGETLFVAGEEKLGDTLQKKIDAVKHPCLHVTGAMPEDLTPFDFIILDSVTRLRLTPEHLRVLKAAYPEKSFIQVYQVTKSGKFRGTNEAQHDVDVVIEIPEKGRAVQFGRYNQGGEMNIFDADEYGLAA